MLRPVTKSVFLFFSLENDPVPSFSRKLEKKADREQPFCTGPGVLVDNRINMTQQYALAGMKDSNILLWNNKKIATRAKEVIFPLYLAIIKKQLEYCIHFCTSQCKKDAYKLK